MDYNKLTKQKFNQETNKWDTVHQRKISNIMEWEVFSRKNITNNIIKKVEGKNISILEIGCGAGNNLSYFIRKNNDCQGYGVDISDKMIDFCNEKFKNEKKLSFNVLNIDNEKLNKKFDVIVMLGVVGYLEFPDKSFKNVFSMLKDDGLFIFTYGNKKSLFRKIRIISEKIIQNKFIADTIHIFRKVILNRKDYLRYDPNKHFFKLYDFNQINKAVDNKKIINKFNIAFGSGITGPFLLWFSKILEKLFIVNDPLNISMTKLIVVSNKKN